MSFQPTGFVTADAWGIVDGWGVDGVGPVTDQRSQWIGAAVIRDSGRLLFCGEEASDPRFGLWKEGVRWFEKVGDLSMMSLGGQGRTALPVL